MNKIYADVSEDDNVDEPNFQWVVLASEAEEREAALREDLAGLEHWRDLALQFDNHRMTALWHLKTLVADGAHYDAARNFLSEPPIPACDLQGINAAKLEKLLQAVQKYVEKLIDQSKNQDSIATGYLSDILDVIKGKWGLR